MENDFHQICIVSQSAKSDHPNPCILHLEPYTLNSARANLQIRA